MIFNSIRQASACMRLGTVRLMYFQEVDADHYTSLGSISVGAGAKTGRPGCIHEPVFRSGAGLERCAGIGCDSSAGESAAGKSRAQGSPGGWSLLRMPFELDLATMSAHPDLRKMGFHAIPPGGTDSVIIANADVSRIGNKSSQGDLDAVKDGKTYCVRKDDGSYFNAKLPLKDASGRTIGILVMEIPFSSAPTQEQAIHEAEEIRQELAQKIPDSSMALPELTPTKDPNPARRLGRAGAIHSGRE